MSGGASEEEQYGSKPPFGRPGQPAELASIYVQLAAEDALFANGPFTALREDLGNRNGYVGEMMFEF